MRWILIPVIDGAEDDAAFLEKASAGTAKAVIAHVTEANDAQPLASLGTQLKKGEDIVGRIKRKLASKPFQTVEYIEWGNVAEKLASIARLEGVTEIVMPSKENGVRKEVAARLGEKSLKITFY